MKPAVTKMPVPDHVDDDLSDAGADAQADYIREAEVFQDNAAEALL